MFNNTQCVEEMEITEFDMSKYRSKNRKIIIMIGIIFLLIIAIPMSTIFINSKIIESKLDEKYFDLDEKVLNPPGPVLNSNYCVEMYVKIKVSEV